MKKIIFLFLIFSATVFAEWQVEISYMTYGASMTEFVTYDLENQSSYIGIGVDVEDFGFSTITIFHEEIRKKSSLVLVVTDNEGEDIYCNFHSDDIQDYCVKVPTGRASALTKILYNGKSAILINRKKGEILATFDLSGIKEIMEKHVGSSYWYKYKLND